VYCYAKIAFEVFFYVAISKFLFFILQDGNEMPKVITFEDDAPGQTSNGQQDFPVALMKSVCNEEAGKIVLQFLVSDAAFFLSRVVVFIVIPRF